MTQSIGIVTYAQLLEREEKKLREVSKTIEGLRGQIKQALETSFEQKGGCENCGGRGWVVTWDTLDVMDGSCAEYGVCPREATGQCTKETREKSGLHPNHSKHDLRRGVADPVTSSVEFQVMVGPLLQKCQNLACLVGTLRSHTSHLAKFDMAVVTRGNNDRGFVGQVFWLGTSKKGFPRVGLRKVNDNGVPVKGDDGKDIVVWTGRNNVDVIAKPTVLKQLERYGFSL